MELKKIHMGTVSFSADSMHEVSSHVFNAIGSAKHLDNSFAFNRKSGITNRVFELVLALCLCHNVTPVLEDGKNAYQASSPDEIAIVNWTEAMGLTLIHRDTSIIKLRSSEGHLFQYEIIETFPFTSESKRMGIILANTATGQVVFFQKGADSVMSKIVAHSYWLDEECGNMAREGLRTLVVGRKILTRENLRLFQQKYHEAKLSMYDRKFKMEEVVKAYLESDLELLGITGVEDKLQDDLKLTFEMLRNAGFRIWMLTGDKFETAKCIALSSKLVSKNHHIYGIEQGSFIFDIAAKYEDCRMHLDFLNSNPDSCLIIDGQSLQTFLDSSPIEFVNATVRLPAVVCSRCSPTQKSEIVRLFKDNTNKRTCAIGDGGNDVSMIQTAHVGIGIVGKEGMQASLASDFSVTQFSHIARLLLWHGRNSYKRTSKLAHFVIHRGLIISVMQAVFSALFYFAPIALYQGALLVGYTTVYTMAPVFSLVLDRDIGEDTALLYPELYKELSKGRTLSIKTFLIWFAISIYQGGTIMILAIWLFENEFVRIVSISFTALIFNELLMVALEIFRWHPIMVYAQILTILFYIGSMWLLPGYFDIKFIATWTFILKVLVITAVSSAPLFLIKLVKNYWSPPSYMKLEEM
jgi:phospholipid-translocating ATPase